jgi:hypothetical protein
MRHVLPLLCALGLLAGCGGSEHARVDPESMLDSAAAHPIRSARVEGEVRVRAAGSSLPGPVRVRIDGPYRSGGGSRIPSFDWRVSASALGFPVGGRLISTGTNVFLSVLGNQYEVGGAEVAVANRRLAEGAASGAPGSAPRDWLGRPRVVGEGSVGGVDCERISAPLRGRRVAAAIAPLAEALGLAAPSLSGRATACVGFDDRVLHGLEVNARLRPTPTGGTLPGGASSISVSAGVQLSEVGEPVSISPPGGASRPIRDLLLTLNDFGLQIPLG